MKKSSILIFSIFCVIVAHAQVKKAPKMVVGIVVDQMCYDYLYRYQYLYTTGGFNRLLTKGTNCRSAQYTYVPTYTAPGHASIYTGTTPSDHGIVANEWYDRESKAMTTSVSDKRYQSVGTSSTEGQASPMKLRSYTITDQLKMASPRSKVISISIKDRSAILPGGHLSDGSYWYDYSSGTFITSSFYMKTLPDWVQRFNVHNSAAKRSKTWNLLLPESTYQQADESPYEVVLPGKKTATFPYDFEAMANEGFNLNTLITISPTANEVLTDFALMAMEQENLGKDLHPDFLCISYSTPDIAGHAFGPYSREMEDMYARLDRELQRLFAALETRYGKDGFVLFLTADHAVVPVPEMLVKMNLPGGYIYMNDRLQVLRDDFIMKYNSDLLESEHNQNIYLNLARIDSLKLSVDEVASYAASEIRKWPEVKSVLTQAQLRAGEPMADPWGAMVQRGFDQQRSGELIFLLQPGYLAKESNEPKVHQGTSHGSSFNYDTHVPLLWYGAGIPQGQNVYRAVQVIDIAPTLIQLLNLQRSGAMTGQPILEVLPKN
ncbi:MAG: hypothetical protein RLZZ301_599 [Bacteroidota bacterium]|jgi:arylsulfatase A-like enzyme